MTEKLSPATQYPIKALVEKFWPDYGGLGDYFDEVVFPEVISHGDLIRMGANLLKPVAPAEIQRVQAWAADTIEFAQTHSPEPSCGMRQVFAAAESEVINTDHTLLGRITVCGMNGLPPDHVRETRFTQEETYATVVRVLSYLLNQGQISSQSEFMRIMEEAGKKIQGRVLSCPEIGEVIRDCSGVAIPVCRRRTGTVSPLPKDHCPSILCAEGDALSNRAVGEIIWQLVAEEGLENVTIMPVVRFPTDAKGKVYFYPAEYTVYYKAEGAKGKKEGAVKLDSMAIYDLARNSRYEDGVNERSNNEDLGKVRQYLRPSAEQTAIDITNEAGPENTYYYQRIYYFDPDHPENRTETAIVDIWNFAASLRFKSYRGRHFGEHSLTFATNTITSSDVPCPRCTKLIAEEYREKLVPHPDGRWGVEAVPGGDRPLVVIPQMTFRPDYYEPADLWALLNHGVIVVNEEFLK